MIYLISKYTRYGDRYLPHCYAKTIVAAEDWVAGQKEGDYFIEEVEELTEGTSSV